MVCSSHSHYNEINIIGVSYTTIYLYSFTIHESPYKKLDLFVVLCFPHTIHICWWRQHPKSIILHSTRERKMANTMTMQEQIELSGLEIMSSLLSSSSLSSSLQLQWNSTNQWSPLLGGGREMGIPGLRDNREWQW